MALEGGLIATADVSCAFLDQLFCHLVISEQTITGDHHLIRGGAQPFAVFEIPVISLEHGPFVDGICIVKSKDETATISLDVLGVDYDPA